MTSTLNLFHSFTFPFFTFSLPKFVKTGILSMILLSLAILADAPVRRQKAALLGSVLRVRLGFLKQSKILV
jgi:hypothetical protein